MRRIFHLPFHYYIYLTATLGFVFALIILFLFPNQPKPNTAPIAIETTPQPSLSPATTTPAAQPVLQARPLSYANAVQRAVPSVVNIFTRKPVQQKPNPATALFDFPQNGFQSNQNDNTEVDLGSGVIVSSQGHILTNNHVIKDAQSIEVMLHDGRYLNAGLIGHDPETDLAVLKVSAHNLPVIPFGQSVTARVGDVVLAIGNPYGVGQTVTSGIISALNRAQLGLSTFEDYIQTDAPINPGNSGGALINTHGELIAINTAIISPSGGSQGISFAIPIDSAKKVMQQLIEHGSVIRGWIGVRAVGISPERSQQVLGYVIQGLVIVGTVNHGPAAQAGLLAGDIITHINSHPIESVEQALTSITNLRPGETATLNGMRNNQSFQVEIIATRRPNMQ